MFNWHDEFEEPPYMVRSEKSLETPTLYLLNKQYAKTLQVVLNCGADPIYCFSNRSYQTEETTLLLPAALMSLNCFSVLLRSGGIVPEYWNLSEQMFEDDLDDLLHTLCRLTHRFTNALMDLLETEVDWSKCWVFYCYYKHYVSSLSESNENRDSHIQHMKAIESRNQYNGFLRPKAKEMWPNLFSFDDIEFFGIDRNYPNVSLEDVFEEFHRTYYPFRPMPLKKVCRGRIRQLCGRTKLVPTIQNMYKSGNLPKDLTEYLLYGYSGH